MLILTEVQRVNSFILLLLTESPVAGTFTVVYQYKSKFKIMYILRIFARASILQTNLLGQISKKYFFFQARCFTGNVLPWYRAAQLKGIISKNVTLPLTTIPCAFSSATVKGLAKNIAAVRTAEEYLYLYENFKDSPAMTQVNRITILHYLARFATEDPKNFVSTKKALKKQKDVFAALLQSIAAELKRCKARELASIMWSLGKLREHVSLIVSECEKEIFRRDVTSFKAPSVCQLLNGFACLDLKRSQFFSLIEQSILEGKLKMSDFENHGLAGALWSFSKTGNGSRKLFEKFQEEILSRNVKKFSSAQLVQFLWSFTQKEMQCDKLFEITAQEILERPMADLSDYSINMLLSLFAKADPDTHACKEQGNFELFDCLGAEVRRRGVHRFDTKELSMLVWSFAKRCPKVESVFDIVEKELHIRGISKLRNEELSLILWSFAKSGHFSAELFNACREEILSRDLSLFKANQLSQLIWAFGMSTVPSLGFFSSAEKEVLTNVSNFSDKELFMILHGFSHASAGTHKLFTKLEREVLERNIPENKPEIIPEVASVFSSSNYEATLTFDRMEKVLKATDQSVFNEQELQEIKMAFFKVGRELSFTEYKEDADWSGPGAVHYNKH